MSRNNGTVSLSANIELQIAGPIDARDIVETYASLTDPNTWLANDKIAYPYVGMKTTVINDPDTTKNGTYRLTALPVTNASNWLFVEGSGSVSIDPNTVILKGRVDTVDLLPTENNKNGDVWLVGLEDAEAFDKYIYIEEVSRFEEITSPALEAIVNDLISRTIILETKIEQKVDTSSIGPMFEEAFAGFKKKNMLPVHLLDIDVEISEENKVKLFNPDNVENIELIAANDGPSEDRRFTFWVCKTTSDVDYNLTRFSHFEYKYVGTYSFNIVAYAYMTKEDYENKTNPVRFVQKIEESNPYETPEEADIRIIYISEEFQSAYALEYTITSATPGSNVAFIYLGVYQQSLEVNIPVASETQLGGVKIGYGLDITPDGALYVNNVGGGVEELTTRVDMLEDIVVGTSVVDSLPMISAPLPGDEATVGGIYQNTIFFLRTPGEEDPMYPGIPTYTYSAHVGIDMEWVTIGGGSGGSSPSTGGVSIKGRVEMESMLPITENVDGDIWLVGSHLDTELKKFIYIAEFSRFEQLGGSIVPSGGFIKVDILPAAGADVTKIYLVPKAAGEEESENILDEFIYVDGVWELIGTRKIDISGLATIEALDAIDTRLTEAELELLAIDVDSSVTKALDVVFSGMDGENMLPTFAVTPSHLSSSDQTKLYDKNNTSPVSLASGNGNYSFSVVRDPSVSRYTKIELRYLNTTANANLSCTAYMTKEDYDNKENGITVIDDIRVDGSTDIQIFEIPEANQTAYGLVNILSISHGGGYPLQCAYIGVYHKSYDLPISESVREDLERINNALEFVDKIDFTSPTLTSNDSSNVFKITSEHEDVWKLFDGDSTSTLHFMTPVTFDITLQTPMILKSYKFSSILKPNVNFSAVSLVITDINTDTNIHSLPLNGSETVAKNIDLSDNVIASDKYRFVITGHSNGYPGSAADTLDLNFEIDYNGSKTIYDINNRITKDELDLLEISQNGAKFIKVDTLPEVDAEGNDPAAIYLVKNGENYDKYLFIVDDTVDPIVKKWETFVTKGTDTSAGILQVGDGLLVTDGVVETEYKAVSSFGGEMSVDTMFPLITPGTGVEITPEILSDLISGDNEFIYGKSCTVDFTSLLPNEYVTRIETKHRNAQPGSVSIYAVASVTYSDNTTVSLGGSSGGNPSADIVTEKKEDSYITKLTYAPQSLGAILYLRVFTEIGESTVPTLNAVKEYVSNNLSNLPIFSTDEEYIDGTSTTKSPTVKQVSDDFYITGIVESDTFTEELYEVPALTANGAMYVDAFAVSASSQTTDSYPAWRAVDGTTTLNTAWISGGGILPQYFNIGFLTPKKITNISVTNRVVNSSGTIRASLKTFTLQGSKTNVVGEETWIDIQSYTNDNNDSGGVYEVSIDESNQDYYYGYRFKIDEANHVDNAVVMIGELALTVYDKIFKIKVKDLAIQNYEDIKSLGASTVSLSTDAEYSEGTATNKAPTVKQITEDLYVASSEGNSFDELWEQPILTANGTMYVDEMAVSSSSTSDASDFKPLNGTVVGDLDCWFSDENTALPVYYQIGFKSPKKIIEFTITNRIRTTEIHAQGAIKTFTLQGSKTNVVGEETWVDIQSYTNDNNNSKGIWTKSVDIENQDYYYGYRFKIDENIDDGTGYTFVIISSLDMVIYNELHKISVKNLTEQNTDAIKVLQAGSLDTDLNKLTTAGVDRLTSLFSIEEIYYDTPVVFTESDSYIVSTSGKYVLLCGAGGSGGCGTGGGGAGGGTSSVIVDLAEGDVLTVTVGAGGRGYAVSGPVTAATGGNSSVKKGSTTLSTTVAATACNGDTGGKGRAGTNGFAGGDGGTTTSSSHDIGVGGNGGGHGLPGFGFEYLAEVLTTPTGEPGTKLDTSNEPGLPTIAGGGGGGGNSASGTVNAGAGGRGSVVIIPVKYRAMTAINYSCVIKGSTTGASNEVQSTSLGDDDGRISINQTYTLQNPFGNNTAVLCTAEVENNDVWSDVGFSEGKGVKATFVAGKGIVVKVGTHTYIPPSVGGGGNTVTEESTQSLRCRVHVWKLVGINPDQTSSSSFELPIATAEVLGGIKVGSGLEVDSEGVLKSLAKDIYIESDTETGENTLVFKL